MASLRASHTQRIEGPTGGERQLLPQPAGAQVWFFSEALVGV